MKIILFLFLTFSVNAETFNQLYEQLYKQNPESYLDFEKKLLSHKDAEESLKKNSSKSIIDYILWKKITNKKEFIHLDKTAKKLSYDLKQLHDDKRSILTTFSLKDFSSINEVSSFNKDLNGFTLSDIPVKESIQVQFAYLIYLLAVNPYKYNNKLSLYLFNTYLSDLEKRIALNVHGFGESPKNAPYIKTLNNLIRESMKGLSSSSNQPLVKLIAARALNDYSYLEKISLKGDDLAIIARLYILGAKYNFIEFANWAKSLSPKKLKILVDLSTSSSGLASHLGTGGVELFIYNHLGFTMPVELKNEIKESMDWNFKLLKQNFERCNSYESSAKICPFIVFLDQNRRNALMKIQSSNKNSQKLKVLCNSYIKDIKEPISTFEAFMKKVYLQNP